VNYQNVRSVALILIFVFQLQFVVRMRIYV